MINRKVLYGYQIQNGTLEIVPEEQRTVSMVFTLYNAGASYQAISDALNRQGVPYCREVPLWNKHKVKRLLENPVTPVRRDTPYWWKRIFSQAAPGKDGGKEYQEAVPRREVCHCAVDSILPLHLRREDDPAGRRLAEQRQAVSEMRRLREYRGHGYGCDGKRDRPSVPEP